MVPLKTFCILLSPSLLLLYSMSPPSLPTFALQCPSQSLLYSLATWSRATGSITANWPSPPLLKVCYHVPSLPPSLLNCALFRVLTQRLSNSLAVFSFKAGWADPPLPTPCYCVSPPYYTLPTCALECSSKSLSYSLVSPAACSFNAAKSFFVFSSSVFKGRIANFKNLKLMEITLQ